MREKFPFFFMGLLALCFALGNLKSERPRRIAISSKNPVRSARASAKFKKGGAENPPVMITIETRVYAGDFQAVLPEIALNKEGAILTADTLQAAIRMLADTTEDAAPLCAPRLTVFESQEASMTVGDTEKYIEGWTRKGAKFEPITKEIRPGITMTVTARQDAAANRITLDVRCERCELLGMCSEFVYEKSGADGENGRPQIVKLRIEKPLLKNAKWSGTARLGERDVWVAKLESQQSQLEGSKPVYILMNAKPVKFAEEPGEPKRETIDLEF